MFKRLALLIVVCVLVLAAVLVLNTLRFASKQVSVEAAPPLSFDLEAAVDRLSEAVQYPTISHQDPADFDSKTFLNFHKFLEKSFPKVREKLKREVVSDFSLLYTWEGSDASLNPIILAAHMDVVPVSPGTEAAWEHDAYSGAREGGYVWGRGTLDDKVNLMAALEAVEIALSEGMQPQRTVYLAFGHDEEVGGALGASAMAQLLDERGVEAEFVLDEGGAVITGAILDVRSPVATIGIAEKGYITLELSAKGEGGHSSQPGKESVIGILAKAVNSLEENQMPSGVVGPARQMLEHVGPESGFATKLIMANLWLTAPLVERIMTSSPATNAMVRTTTAPTIFEAGVKENVLPVNGRAVVNFRILPGDTIDSVMEHVRATVADPRVSVNKLPFGSNPSKVSPSSGPIYDQLERTIRETQPGTIVTPYLVVGATDARFYEILTDHVYRFSAMRLDTSDLHRLHGTNERVGEENYGEIVRFYHRLIQNTAM